MARKINKLYIGPPGVGKTATVKAKYAYTEVLLLSGMTEDDLGGLPYLVEGKERRTQPHWLERLLTATDKLAPGQRACLFADELDKSRREVADTMLTLICNPEQYGIPDNVDIVAAANPPEWSGGDGISKPMLSRFSVINFVPNAQAVAEHLKTKYPQAAIVLDLIACGELPLFEHAGEGYDTRITCPRTWEMAIAAWCQGENAEVISGLLTGNAANGLLTSMLSRSDADMFKTPDEDYALPARRIGNKKVNVWGLG